LTILVAASTASGVMRFSVPRSSSSPHRPQLPVLAGCVCVTGGFSLGWAIATASAVAAFLLVERQAHRTDIAASVLLLVGVASTSVAVAFVVGLAAELAMQRAWRRLWIVGVPVAAYAVWFIGYGSGTSDYGSAGAVLRFVERLLAQTTGTLLGVQARGTWAHITLGVAAVAFVALWLKVGRPVTPRLVGLVVALGTYLLVLAVARASFGVTTWYSYPSAVLVLLVFGELLRGRSFPTPVLAIVVVVAAWAVVWNLGQMRDGGDELRKISRVERAELLAVDLSADRVPPSFKPENYFLRSVTAGAYFTVEHEYGTPAFTIHELRDAPGDARRAADKVLVRAMRIKAVPGGFDVPTPSCTEGAVQRVDSAVVLVQGAGIRVGVFGHGVRIERTGGPVSRIDLPPLADPRAKWVIRARDGARVCTLPGSAGGLT
jgi:hypothetical protein